MPSFLASKDYTRQWVRFQGPRRTLCLLDLIGTLLSPPFPRPERRGYKKSLNTGTKIVCRPLPLPGLLGWP